jgi:cytochrome c-type biogenesis protein CcmH/NrfG
MGKQPEAIRQFEVLLSNQEALPARPEFAQTYLFLGNLYHQKGDQEKAAETYKKGAGLFPQNDELARKSAEAEEK